MKHTSLELLSNLIAACRAAVPAGARTSGGESVRKSGLTFPLREKVNAPGRPDEGTVQTPVTLAMLRPLFETFLSAAAPLSLGDEEVPFGRYLLHQEDAFNLQLDVFSRGYRGAIHTHDTWGMFVVLRGALWCEDFLVAGGRAGETTTSVACPHPAPTAAPPSPGGRTGSVLENEATPVRTAHLPTGGASAFVPPQDWHRVGTPVDGPQTLSLHLYGPGFDLDEGTALGEDGRLHRYRRSAFGPVEGVRRLLGER